MPAVREREDIGGNEMSKRKWILPLVVLAVIFCAGGCKKESPEPEGIVWERGRMQIPEEGLRHLMEEPAEGESVRIVYKNVFVESEEEIWEVIFREGAYRLRFDEKESVYAHLLFVEEGGSGGRRFLVLTDREEMDFRTLWREMWVRPDLREKRMFVLCWDGEVSEVNREAQDTVAEEYRKEADILLGIDELALVWAEEMSGFREDEETSFYPASGVLVVKGTEMVSGEEEWQKFAERSAKGLPSRITVVRVSSDKSFQNVFAMKSQFVSQVYYAGEFYDYRDYKGDQSGEDFRYLIEDELDRNPGTWGWFLCREEYEHPSTHYSKEMIDALFPDRPIEEFEDPVQDVFYYSKAQSPVSGRTGELDWFKDYGGEFEFSRNTLAYMADGAKELDWLYISDRGLMWGENNDGSVRMQQRIQKRAEGFVWHCEEQEETYRCLNALDAELDGQKVILGILSDEPPESAEEAAAEMFVRPDRRNVRMRVVFWQFYNEDESPNVPVYAMAGDPEKIPSEFRAEADVLWNIREEALGWE